MQIDEQLFNEFKKITTDIECTSGVVQNNYDLLIDDGHINYDDVHESYNEYTKRMRAHIADLERLHSLVKFRLVGILDTLSNMDQS